MTTRNFRLILALGTALTGTSAYAQEQADTGASPSSSTEIIVTAQRRSESLQKIPVSLTAVTSDIIQSRQINDLSQIARAAPSLQIGSDNGFSVRGVGTLTFTGTIDSSVALSLDEVNLGRPFLAAPQFIDLERVEVLNGPQGLLFGKNASAGLLNIVTAKPKLGVYSSKTDVEIVQRDTPDAAGSASGVVVREVLNIPLGANAAFRLNALYSYQEPGTTFVGTPLPGVRNDTDNRSYTLKGKFLYEPSEALSIYIIGDYTKNSGVAGAFDRPYLKTDPTSINLPALNADGLTAGEDNFSYGGERGYYRDLKTGGAQANIAYELDSGIEISNLAAWRFYKIDQQYDIDNLSADGASINLTDGRYDQYSNEFKVALPAGNRLSGQVGLFYFKSTLDQSNLIRGSNYISPSTLRGFPFCVGAPVNPGPPPNCSVSNVSFLGRDNDYVLNTESYAGFGQLTYDVTDQLELIAGGRWTRDKVSINLTQGQFPYFTNLGGPRGTLDRSYSNTDFSWKLGAQFQATPDIMLYGFYGRGYKGPGFNDVAPNVNTDLVVREETSKTAEIGFKTAFFDRKLTFNVSAFHTKFDDFQVQSFDPIVRTFQILNAAKVTTKGFEVNMFANPVEGLSFNGSASVLDAKFDSFPGAQCYPTQATGGCSLTVQTFDAAGLNLPNAPKFTATVQGKYEFQTSGSTKPFIEANWYYRSSVKPQTAETPGATIPRVHLIGASFGAQLGENVRLSLFCRNCTNQHLPVSISTEPGDASARNNRGQATPKLTLVSTYSLDSFRSVGANMSVKF